MVCCFNKDRKKGAIAGRTAVRNHRGIKKNPQAKGKEERSRRRPHRLAHRNQKHP